VKTGWSTPTHCNWCWTCRDDCSAVSGGGWSASVTRWRIASKGATRVAGGARLRHARGRPGVSRARRGGRPGERRQRRAAEQHDDRDEVLVVGGPDRAGGAGGGDGVGRAGDHRGAGVGDGRMRVHHGKRIGRDDHGAGDGARYDACGAADRMASGRSRAGGRGDGAAGDGCGASLRMPV
jgi:hypothetical protein